MLANYARKLHAQLNQFNITPEKYKFRTIKNLYKFGQIAE